MPAVSVSTSHVVDAESPKQSEQAVLHGHRALTPMISGAVSGGTIAILWIVGLTIYIYRRYRGHQQVRSAGLRTHRELDIPPPKPEAYIVPPDPAVVQGFRTPGERVVPDDPRADGEGKPKYARTVPFARTEKRSGEKEKNERWAEGKHTNSAPQLPTVQEFASSPSLSDVYDRLHVPRSRLPGDPKHDLRPEYPPTPYVT